ncbi:MAG: (E)-4-hydroxy-3-methylbut-2-enyl-diphosphate synthase [Paludibacteraceae bacterium]|nr:(E)-4-hydroxy-3-methylbut-2-enyl-diphosphate synthase [Paludibacteraceae bacterium]
MEYTRRTTNPVQVGRLQIGGGAPVRLQSMLNTSTNDTGASVEQAIRIVRAGGELVRATTQGVKEAANMALIRRELDRRGYEAVPLVADVHFNPKVADEALLHCEKVRINPGNYAQTYDEIEQKFPAFLQACRAHGTAIRIGVNHGSLSRRMLDRYGDTPEGMVASCMEFLRICQREGFDQVVLSVKASNTRVMVYTVRQLVRAMEAEDMHYPLHLGVTEAGAGEDGRIKSAVGIGTLLAEGLGDTIRVSLSEAPEAEIPVARRIVALSAKTPAPAGPLEYRRRCPAAGQVRVMADGSEIPAGWQVVEAGQPVAGDAPAVVHWRYDNADFEEFILEGAVATGRYFINGDADGLWIEAPKIAPESVRRYGYDLLQATRARMSKTEYISCPTCGRTLFDMETTLARVKAATAHLSHLKIGVMGCIVNGPGEMADADYGYVGAGRGTISLYQGKTCIEKNIPEAEAVGRLIALIKQYGDWREPLSNPETIQTN